MRNGDGNTARREQSVIVLRVSDTGRVLGCDAELPERGQKSEALVYARRIDEDGTFVVREFARHSGFLDRPIDGGRIGSPGFQDDFAGE